MTVQPISVLQIAVATLLVVFCGVLSVAFRLKLEKQLAVASVRTIVSRAAAGHDPRQQFDQCFADARRPAGGRDAAAGEIEMELSHGASAWEAAHGPLEAAVRREMVPTINSLLVVGIVSLPGMMTGQILAGSDPLEAVKYQIVVMFMLAAATALGGILIVLLAYRQIFTVRHQLAERRLTRSKKSL